MSERNLYKFYWDCGRSGEVEGLFVATEEEVKKAIGVDLNFGEILGKHSEVFGTLDKADITIIDLDSETVEKVSSLLGNTWSGYNPLGYIEYLCPECGCKYYEDDFDLVKGKCNYCHE